MNKVKIFQKVFRNFLSMISHRGFNTKEMLESINNYEFVMDIYANRKDYFEFNKNKKKMVVVFLIYEKINKKYVTDTLCKYDLQDYSKDLNFELVLIYNDPQKKKLCNSFNNSQIFCFPELYIDKLSHCLVPKHDLITDETQQNEILSAYSLDQKKKWCLPVMLKSDPITKYFNAKKGDIFRITRNSPLSGKHTVYRIVN